MRARTKRLEDIDPGMVCCEKLAEKFRETAGTELELTAPIFTGYARCIWCGRAHPRLRYATVVGNPFSRELVGTKVDVIALAFVDLDEGAEEELCV